ncbi:MAG TPA: cation transporter dimerization domain-containing protein [bacterium]|nr:cation transporter dimerization domain-containing protein [bacterium]
MGYFEIGMLLCFGISWPISISKTLRIKNVEGKSVVFLYIIIIGYLFGIAHKYCIGNFNWVTYLYALNACMVSFDVYLWHKYSVSKKVKESIQIKILKQLALYYDYYTQFHGIRTRRAGHNIFIEVFLEFNGNKSMDSVQKAVNQLKLSIEKNIPYSEVLIIPSNKKIEF